MKKSIFIALTIVFTAACIFLFNIFYKEAKNSAIEKLNEEQMIHAKTAVREIEDFFAMWTQRLNSLAMMDEIVDNNAAGKRNMKIFYYGNSRQIMAITRVNEKGIIINSIPQNSTIGTDISKQEYIRDILKNHKPVVSDLFRQAGGVNVIALHVPVFRGAKFKGTIGILINFESSITKRYLDVIKIGQTGYAWVLSRDGTILYSPVPGFTGKSGLPTVLSDPSFIEIADDMLKGNEGTSGYTFDRIGNRNVGSVKKYAVYMPIHIGNTFWSIAVTSAEQDVLSDLISFRDKLAIVVSILFICGMVFATLAAKAWFIVKEREKREEAEKKLEESEQVAEKFSALFHAAPFAMAMTTVPDGMLYDVNQAWLDLAGANDKKDAVGKQSSEFGIIQEKESRDKIVAAFRQHGLVRNAEIITVRKDGKKLALLVNLDWVKIGNSKFILSTTQDITERKIVEDQLARQTAELQERTARLEEINRELESFSYSISHDLRAPLRAIDGFARMILKKQGDKFDEDTRIKFNVIRESSQKMGQLIDDLLNLSRLGKQQINIKELNMVDLAEDVWKELQAGNPERVIELVIKEMPEAYGDRTLIKQIYLNLLGNAIKFTKRCPHARIEVGAYPGEKENTYYIKDNGAGFDMAYYNKLFGVFQRLHATEDYEGTGIGLAIVHRIIHRQGGIVWAEGVVDKGATFYFTLPATYPK